MYCEEVKKHAAFCGGAGYAISGAALRALTKQGLSALVDEYGGKEVQKTPNDVTTSCALRKRSIPLEHTPHKTTIWAGFPLARLSDFEGMLRRKDVYTLHYVPPDVLRFYHAASSGADAKTVSHWRDVAFEKGCAKGMKDSPLARLYPGLFAGCPGGKRL